MKKQKETFAYEYLENVECLELYGAALFPQHVHHELQVVRATDVLGHHVEIVPIQQQFTQ